MFACFFKYRPNNNFPLFPSFVFVFVFVFFLNIDLIIIFLFFPALEEDDYDNEDDQIAVADEAASSDAVSSWGSQYNTDAPMMQMTQMMKVIGENLKEKMRVSIRSDIKHYS